MKLSLTSTVASLMLIVSSVTSSYYFAKIISIEKSRDAIEIPVGQSNYNYFWNDTCIGSIKLNASQTESGIAIFGDGKINVSLLGIQYPFQTELRAEFNALNQLGGFYLKLISEKVALTFGTTNVNPINVIVDVTVLEERKRLNTTIAGPITIDGRLKDKYLISAENAQLEINSLDALSSQPLIQQLSLKREEQICNNPDALNLDGLLNLLVSISSSIPRWQK